MIKFGLSILVATVIAAGWAVTPASAVCPRDGCPAAPPVYSGAPGPIAGAGLPILVAIGGAYYLSRRLRRNKR